MSTALPSPDTIRQEEHQKIVRRVLWMRVFILPIGALLLALIVLLDRPSWKSQVLGSVVVLLLAVSVYDYIRVRRGDYPLNRVPIDLGIAILFQTVMIWMTGALESPLIVVYIPMGLVAGFALGPTWGRRSVVWLAVLLVWLMTLAGLFGWVPRTTPSFLDLGPGFFDRPIYALTKAGILTLVISVGSRAGVAGYRASERMLATAIAAREQALEALSDRNRELVYLSGAIAHELKNPLASIQGLVQLLERAGAEERQAARLEVLRKEIARMRTTLDELLNFSRPLGELTLQEIDCARLADELTSLHEGIAQAKQIVIASPPAVPPLRCDPRKVKQALVNLLQNALEATPPGGRVEWIARQAGACLELGLRDSGPGMPAELLESVYLGQTTKPRGSGIGLSVARVIAQQHGGSLVTANLPAGGCEVVLRLPLDPAAAPRTDAEEGPR